jgi:hypothetical protein
MPFDVLMIPAPTAGSSLIPFSAEEIVAIRTFLQSGNGLWVIHDASALRTGVNTLASEFEVEFMQDAVLDSTDNEGETFWPTISMLASHPLTVDVASFGYYAGCCVATARTESVVASGDADAYSQGCQVMPPVLLALESPGRAVFVGDNTPMHPSYYLDRLRPEEQRLLQNTAVWLLGPPPNAVEGESWGRVKGRFR